MGPRQSRDKALRPPAPGDAVLPEPGTSHPEPRPPRPLPRAPSGSLGSSRWCEPRSAPATAERDTCVDPPRAHVRRLEKPGCGPTSPQTRPCVLSSHLPHSRSSCHTAAPPSPPCPVHTPCFLRRPQGRVPLYSPGSSCPKLELIEATRKVVRTLRSLFYNFQVSHFVFGGAALPNRLTGTADLTDSARDRSRSRSGRASPAAPRERSLPHRLPGGPLRPFQEELRRVSVSCCKPSGSSAVETSQRRQNGSKVHIAHLCEPEGSPAAAALEAVRRGPSVREPHSRLCPPPSGPGARLCSTEETPVLSLPEFCTRTRSSVQRVATTSLVQRSQHNLDWATEEPG